MGSWTTFVTACVARHGVGTLALGLDHGLSRNAYYELTERDGWVPRYKGVRIVAGTEPSVRTDLMAFCASTRGLVAVAAESALWLHGLLDRPPNWQQVVTARVIRHEPVGKINVRRARWLKPADIVAIDEIPTLTIPIALISMAERPERELLAAILQARQQGKLTLEDLDERLSDVGPIRGRASLRRLVAELMCRSSESIFDDELRQELHRRGYLPSAGPVRLQTPDRRGIRPDIRLPWFVLIEAEGDAHHKTRQQRRNDRRRLAQVAGTDCVVVPVDWIDWMLHRESVFEAIDAAILKQWERGYGREHPLPPHLRPTAG